MRERLQNVFRYLLARLQEASTWRGIALILSVVGSRFKPEWTEAFVLAGLGAAGIIGALFPDKPPQ